jgi:hypothetical protein
MHCTGRVVDVCEANDLMVRPFPSLLHIETLLIYIEMFIVGAAAVQWNLPRFKCANRIVSVQTRTGLMPI